MSASREAAEAHTALIGRAIAYRDALNSARKSISESTTDERGKDEQDQLPNK